MFRGLITRNRSHRRSQRVRRALHRQRGRTLLLESLETRHLLSVTPLGGEVPEGSQVNSQLESGIVVFQADPAASNFELSLDPAGRIVRLLQDGALVFEHPLATLNELTLNANSLDNMLRVDLTNGIPIPVDGLYYNGGDQATEIGDGIQIVGGNSYATTYTPTVDRDGILELRYAGASGNEVRPIYFTSLEPVLDNILATELFINGTGSGNAIRYTNGLGGSIFNGDTGLVAVDNFETIEFNNKSALTLNGFEGSDVVTLNAPLQPAGLMDILVNGGIDNEVVNLLAANVPNLTIDGEMGNNVVAIAGPVPGVFNSGNITLHNTALAFEIGGTMPGDGAGLHDQLNVNGDVTLGTNVTLDTRPFDDRMGLLFVPVDGDQFVIVNNDGTDMVTGSFVGLPEGALLSNNFLGSGLNAYLTYAGGTDANDVVILINGAPAITGTATGLAIDDNAILNPFAGVTIADASPTLTATVTLSGGDTNGLLTNLGTFVKTGPGAYRLAGATSAAINNAIRALQFDPTENQVAPGQVVTTTMTIMVDDGINPASTDNRTTVMTTSVNDAPVSGATSSSAVEDGPAVTVPFNSFDADVDDDPTTLTYTFLSQPAEGSLTSIVSNTFVFDPGNDFQDLTVGQTRAVTFTYQATDRHTATSNIASATITVVGVNDAPSFTLGANPQVLEDTGSEVIGGFAGAIDAGLGDASQSLTFNVSLVSTTGNLVFDANPVISPTGELKYTVTDDTNGQADFEVTLRDDGGTSGPLAINLPPAGGLSINDGDTFTIDEDPLDALGPRTFEFDSGSTVAAGNVTIPFTVASTAEQIADEIVFAINSLGIQLAPMNLGGGRVLIAGSSTSVVVDVTLSPSLSLFFGTGGQDLSTVQTFSIAVAPVNDAPVLTPTGLQRLTATDEDTASGGDLVSSIVAATIADIDAGAVEGIAITGSVGNGRWEFSTDAGANFSPIGSVTPTQALLLRAIDLVRYVPDGASGETATITYRGWDQTGPTFGQQGTKVDVVVNGATTPFSVAMDSASIVVADVNDAPIIDSPTQAGTISETADATPAVDGDPTDATGTITFDDLDLLDAHTATITAANVSGSTLANGSLLTAGQANMLLAGLTLGPVSFSNITGAGSVTWTYAISNANIDFLGAMDSVELTFAITVNDGAATATQNVVVTVRGANDRPSVVAIDVTGAVTEDASSPLNDSGSITFDDVDGSDLSSASVMLLSSSTTGPPIPAPLAVALGAALTLSGDAVATPAHDGTVNWNFMLNNALVQYLAGGETITATYSIKVDDNSGAPNAAISQNVTVVVTGENDRPVIVVVNVAGAVTEDSAATLTVNGSVTFAEADDTNVLTSSVVKTTESTTSVPIPVELSAALDAAVSITQFGTNEGTIVWNFVLDNSLVQYLGVGETVTATYALDVNDNSGATNSAARQEFDVVVTGVNDAPVLSGTASFSLPPISVNTTAGAGASIAEVVALGGGDPITDADANAVEGIVVRSVQGSGLWQYSAGGSFMALGGDRLLRAEDRIRYLPDPLVDGTSAVAPSFSFQAWDQTGGTTAFSTVVQTATVQIVRTTVVRDSNNDPAIISDIVPNGKDDRLALSIQGTNLVVTDNSNVVGDSIGNQADNQVLIPLANLGGNLVVNLNEGNDAISLNFQNAPPGFNLNVTINGGDGNDTLTLMGDIPLGSSSLTASNSLEDIFVNGPITTSNGTVTLNASQSLEVNANINTGPSGTFHLAAGADISGNCSQMIGATGTVSGMTGIDGVRVAAAIMAKMESVQGGITGCDGQVVIAAPEATLVAETGIGSALVEQRIITSRQPLRTAVGMLWASAGGIGMFLLNDDPATVNDAPLNLMSATATSAFPYGIVDIAAAGPLIVAGDIDATSIFLAVPSANGIIDVPASGTINATQSITIFAAEREFAGSVSPQPTFLAPPPEPPSDLPLAEGEASRWHNAENPFDVNGDGNISPLDVLRIVNHVNNSGPETLAEGEDAGSAAGHYVDVNRDGVVSPLDALNVINHLNLAIEAEGEGWRANRAESVLPPAKSSPPSLLTGLAANRKPTKVAIAPVVNGVSAENAERRVSVDDDVQAAIVRIRQADFPEFHLPLQPVERRDQQLETLLDEIATDIVLGKRLTDPLLS